MGDRKRDGRDVRGRDGHGARSGGKLGTGEGLSRPPGRDLSHRPMENKFKGMRVGPACLSCSEPCDAGLGWSLSNPRGSRRPQRQGWLCGRCLPGLEAKYHEVEYARDPQRKSFDPVSRQQVPAVWVDPRTGLPRVERVKSLGLEVPVLSDEDVELVLLGERELP